MIYSCNEWDPLKKVVVGTAQNAHFPTKDPTYTASMLEGAWTKSAPPMGFPDQRIIDESEEDLINLCDVLSKLGVEVHRPASLPFQDTITNYDWSTDGQYAYCPRDTHLVIGDTVIEAPMSSRARVYEAVVLDHIRRDAIQHGAKWIAAPHPRLLEHENIKDGYFVLNEVEPVFDAANVCRLGKDLIYLVSTSGNRLGAYWLQNILGSEYKVHIVDMYKSSHIDSTIVPISEGTVVLNGSRVNPENLPTIFKEWDCIYVDECEPRDFHKYPYASAWIGINMLAVNPSTVIVDEIQTDLIKTLEKRNFTVIPLPLRHSRTLGGGFHCVTLDLWREHD